jgi:hypothetical protein
MQKQTSRVRICGAVAVLGLTSVVVGCSESANPVRPSLLSDAGTIAATATTAAPASAANVTVIPQALAAAPLSPTDLENRGWTCFEPPLPGTNKILCSRPNQALPMLGSPDDRPATLTFLVFDGTGSFVGTQLLLRTDLYNGQLCESTGALYEFRAAIGYYECVHTAGR